ncbi:hypothetical protein [Nostoc favosum]|uniref:hypothetical protein n=1 Tax=Nostoc favosum TaxID=2907819 RepID=UPI0027958452|nr:hypothetical protein [Nostoc favosum]
MSLTIKDLEQLQSHNPDWRMQLVKGNIIIMGPSDYESDEIVSRLNLFEYIGHASQTRAC